MFAMLDGYRRAQQSASSRRRDNAHTGQHHFQRKVHPLDDLAQRLNHHLRPYRQKPEGTLPALAYCDRTLITGHEGERDRCIELVEAPRFGIVGKDLTVTV